MIKNQSVIRTPAAGATNGSQSIRDLRAHLRKPWSLLVGVVPLALGLVSCTGSISDGGTGGAIPSPNRAGGAITGPGSGPSGVATDGSYVVPAGGLRRLTRREYNNSVRDLFGDTSSPASKFAADEVGVTGYETPGSLGALEVDAFMLAAEGLATTAVGSLTPYLQCSPKTAAEEEPCATQFIQSFGSRVFRRPVVAAEAADLLALFRDVRQNAKLSFAESIGALMQGMLESPNFIYHRERGAEPPVVVGNLVRLTNDELASRLSYFIAGTTPDAELLRAAAARELLEPAHLEAQARRLAALPGVAAESLTDFSRQWMRLDTDHLEKSAQVYPSFPTIQPLLSAELLGFMGNIVDRGLPPSALFTDSSVYVNRASAAAYGLPPPNTDELTQVAADPTQRSGLFTQLAFLSTHATTTGSHPVKRGKVIFERVLCGIMPAPPPNVPAVKPAQPNQTTRERFTEHETNACATCHKVLDPLGFAFENYGGMGEYRATEGGKPVDASGTLTLPSGGQITFTNAVGLLSQVATTSDARTCLVRHLARYGTRAPEGVDADVAAEILRLPQTDGKLVDLFVSVINTRAFQYRALAEGELP